MNQRKKYYAFISYKSEDIEWAMWLQHELEHYHLPNSYNGHPDIPQELRPIFRDVDELSAGNLPQQIKNALIDSKNLIVICSPQAAKSPWVNQEIETFVSLGKTRCIFPFIVEGDSPKEFFPPALLNLPKEDERLGGDVTKNGRDAAFIKVVAGMLGVGFDSLWNRYEKEKAEDERKAREQRDSLLRLKSRFISEKANDLVNCGDSYTARKLLLEVLPTESHIDLPLTIEAELSLRNSIKKNSTVIKFDSFIKVASVSPDGSLIISAGDDNSLKLWSTYNGKQVGPTFIGHTGTVNSAEFSADGTKIVSTSNDNTIRVWDVQTGSQICAPMVYKRVKIRPMFPEEGLSAFLDDLQGVNKDTANSFNDRGEMAVLENKRNDEYKAQAVSYEAQPNYASFSNDGSRIVSSFENEIIIWNANTGEQIGRPISGHSENVNSVVFDYNGKRIVSASDDKTIKIWDSNTLQQLGQTLIGHSSKVTYASFSPDGEIVISSSWDGTVRLWKIKDQKHIKLRHRLAEYASFSHDGKYIITAGDCKTRVYTIPKRTKVYEGQGNTINLSKDSRYAVSVNWKEIRLTELFGQLERTLLNKCKRANVALFSPNGKTIVSASSDKLLKVWDTQTGSLQKSFKCSFKETSNLAFSPDGKLLISSSWEINELLVWDYNLGELVASHRQLYGITCVVFSPNGRHILCASMDGIIKIIDPLTGTQIGKSMEAYSKKVWCSMNISYCPDGSQFLSCIGDNRIRIWNPETQELINDIDGNLASYSDDGKNIIIATYETVKIINVQDLSLIREVPIPGYLGVITSISLHPHGKYFLYSTSEGEIIIREINTGAIIENWFLGLFSVNSAIFSSDGKSVLTAADDGSIRIWDFPSLEDLINETYQRFKDSPLTKEEREKYFLD